MKAGIVYVLSNPSQPGLFKIGETGDIEARVKELSSGTSVAAPFKVEFTQLSYDCAGDEQKVHYLLKEYRYNTSRDLNPKPHFPSVHSCVILSKNSSINYLKSS